MWKLAIFERWDTDLALDLEECDTLRAETPPVFLPRRGGEELDISLGGEVLPGPPYPDPV